MQVGCFKPQLSGHNVDALCRAKVDQRTSIPFFWVVNGKEKGDLVERRDQVMMIRTKTESVYYPASKQRADLICGSGRFPLPQKPLKAVEVRAAVVYSSQIDTSSDAGLPLMFRRRLFSDHELQLGDEVHEPSSANVASEPKQNTSIWLAL